MYNWKRLGTKALGIQTMHTILTLIDNVDTHSLRVCLVFCISCDAHVHSTVVYSHISEPQLSSVLLW